MSGVYITDMEMPKKNTLVLIKPDGETYIYTVKTITTKAVPVPDHGRLIDADELPRFGGRGGLIHSKDVDNAPTIIPVDKEDEE